ncbi:MAG: hypothetical protein H6817_07145 [Phycisphaerales bacterium]|nr:hypothetical protein [Phycisphaerales bacterium]
MTTVCSTDSPKFPAYVIRYCPEVQYFKSREELRAVRKQYYRTHRRYAWGKIAILYALIVVFYVWVKQELASLGVPEWVTNITSGAVAGAGFAIMIQYLHRRPYQRYLREHLQASGIAICLGCGYDLRGQATARCPECGLAFDEKLLPARQASQP